jgi:hypothetical protein
MGKITRVKSTEVVPYQPYVTWDKIAELLPFFKEQRTDELFPCAVGVFPEGNVAINGHQRFLLADLFGADLNTYLVEREGDLMNHAEFPQYDEDKLWETNRVIAFTYERALACARRMRQGDYSTFENLRLKNGIVDLENLERILREGKQTP